MQNSVYSIYFSSKKFFFIIILLLASSLNAEMLTLKDVIFNTLNNHPDVKKLMLGIKRAEEGYNKTYADYLPQVNLSANYNITQTYVLPKNGTFNTINDTGWNVGITIDKKLWDFSKTDSLLKASKKDEDISKLSLEEVKALLSYKVKSIYQLLIVEKKAISVKEKDLELKRAFYKQSKALVKRGLKTYADSYRFLSAVSMAEDNLAKAKASFEKNKISLSLYMGIKLKNNIELQDNILKKSILLPKNIEDDILNNNYKINIDKLNIEKSKFIYKSTKSTHLGSIDIVASYNKLNTLNSYDTNYIGLNYKLPLYSGGRISAQEQQAKIEHQISKVQQSSDILGLKEELYRLIIDIKSYGKTIEAKKVQLVSAKNTQKVVNARYKEGLATYIEVLDSTSYILNAELNLLETYYSLNIALDRLDYLKGEI